MTVREIGRAVRLMPKEVEDDLHHLVKSLEHSDRKLDVECARCRKCGFEFREDKLTKPSRCPECHSTWIEEPRVRVVK
jgi:predicted Zn-ribbon and HTH transcriptional regulator